MRLTRRLVPLVAFVCLAAFLPPVGGSASAAVEQPFFVDVAADDTQITLS